MILNILVTGLLAMALGLIMGFVAGDGDDVPYWYKVATVIPFLGGFGVSLLSALALIWS